MPGDPLYLEDLEPGFARRTGSYTLERKAVVAFAREWDPQPFHIDEEAARASIFGGLTACTSHLNAIMSKLMVAMDPPIAVMAGLGNDGTVNERPGRVGDTLHVEFEVLRTRPSQSKPDRGIAHMEHRLVNQDGETVMRILGKIMVRRRPGGSA